MVADIKQLWAEILPEVKDGVTGVGVWTALNQAIPVCLDENQFVMGLPSESGDLAGHLRLNQTKTLIEKLSGTKLGQPIILRVIDGSSMQDWENVKRRDAEAKRLQEQAMARQRVEIQSRSSWDTVYDQISRKNSTMGLRSLPQNRAKFTVECLELMVQSLKAMPITDDLAERNYARCIERIAQYAELPSTYIAMMIDARASN
jgi:hypothetical protein